jgi:hypothetical protein
METKKYVWLCTSAYLLEQFPFFCFACLLFVSPFANVSLLRSAICKAGRNTRTVAMHRNPFLVIFLNI